MPFTRCNPKFRIVFRPHASLDFYMWQCLGLFIYLFFHYLNILKNALRNFVEGLSIWGLSDTLGGLAQGYVL